MQIIKLTTSTSKYYRLEKKDIYFVKFILEAYDGIALMKTIDSKNGIVQFLIAPGCENEFNKLIIDLSKDVKIESINILPEK